MNRIRIIRIFTRPQAKEAGKLKREILCRRGLATFFGPVEAVPVTLLEACSPSGQAAERPHVQPDFSGNLPNGKTALAAWENQGFSKPDLRLLTKQISSCFLSETEGKKTGFTA